MTDPRLDLIQKMLDLIPDGYYATQVEDGATVNFLRLSRPTRGKFSGTIKVQTQHSERWQLALVYWPYLEYGPDNCYKRQPRWDVYDRRAIDMVMLIIADHHTCARRYSVELQRCCRCTTELTDDRSRHYLIGPECETHWPWAIEEVDNMEMNLGLSYEQLVARGLPTRVWQDSIKQSLAR